MKTDPFVSPCIKPNSKWIKDLNKRPDTFNMVEEKVGNRLEIIDTGKDFLNSANIKTNNKWNLMNLQFP